MSRPGLILLLASEQASDTHTRLLLTVWSAVCLSPTDSSRMRGSLLLAVAFQLTPLSWSCSPSMNNMHRGRATGQDDLLSGTSRSHLGYQSGRSSSGEEDRTGRENCIDSSKSCRIRKTSTAAIKLVERLRGGAKLRLAPSPIEETPAAIAPASRTGGFATSATSTSTTSTSRPQPTPPSTPPTASSNAAGLANTGRVLGYFALWYALNVWYNIVNKKVLNVVALPASIAVAQLGIGSIWVGTQWLLGVRTRPGKLTNAGVSRLTPVAFFHGGGQLATVLSLGAGAVSFTHVVKAMEPFFSALVAAVWFRQVFRWQVYASLTPVVAGVALACAKEINFSWVSFVAAMVSNLLFACRSNFSKALMTHPPTQDGTAISSANLYGLVTLTAFVVFAPVAALTGWGKWRPAWDLAMKNGHQPKALALSIVMSGVSHYLNNEVMYLALGSVHPTTLAVGNTMKRVFIVVASLIVFKTPISKMGMVGSAIAVGGVLVYSLTKQHYDVLERKKLAGKDQ